MVNNRMSRQKMVMKLLFYMHLRKYRMKRNKRILDIILCILYMISIIILPGCSLVLLILMGNLLLMRLLSRIFRRNIWIRHWPLSLSPSLKMCSCLLYTHVSTPMSWRACQIPWDRMARKYKAISPYSYSWNLLPASFPLLSSTWQEIYTLNDLYAHSFIQIEITSIITLSNNYFTLKSLKFK